MPVKKKSVASKKVVNLIDKEQQRVDDENAKKPEFEAVKEADDVNGVAGKRLLSFFDRIERLEEEKAAIAEDIKEIYAEAKSAGFEVKIMRRILRLRKMDIEKRQEEDELLNLYMAAIGMQ